MRIHYLSPLFALMFSDQYKVRNFSTLIESRLFTQGCPYALEHGTNLRLELAIYHSTTQPLIRSLIDLFYTHRPTALQVYKSLNPNSRKAAALLGKTVVQSTIDHSLPLSIQDHEFSVFPLRSEALPVCQV